MRLLLIDDDPLIADAFQQGLAEEPVEIVRVTNSDDAKAAASEDFDLVVCDLKIPADSGGRDPEVAHGLAVCDHIRHVAPGIPLLIMSGFGTLGDLEDRLAEAPKEEVLGAEKIPLLRHAPKDRLDEVIEAVRRHTNELQGLHNDIEIGWGAEAQNLSRYERQILLLYARMRGGVMIRAQLLPGGRSGAITLRIEVESAQGSITSRGVAKLDSLTEIEAEAGRIEEHVVPLLPAGTYAGSIRVVRAGAGDRGGLFYPFAAGYDRNLFDLLREDPDQAAAAVDRLHDSMEPWQAGPVPASRAVQDVRRGLLSDDRLAMIRGDREDFVDFAVEGKLVQLNECRAHGDLHGGNVLVTEDGSPLLIDFARVGLATTALDPITLEVSAVLHPDAGLDLGGWPTIDQAKRWPSSSYLEGCPILPFIEACHRWLDDVVRGDRERDSTLYAYALRQLRFPDLDHPLAIGYASGAVERLLST